GAGRSAAALEPPARRPRLPPRRRGIRRRRRAAPPRPAGAARGAAARGPAPGPAGHPPRHAGGRLRLAHRPGAEGVMKGSPPLVQLTLLRLRTFWRETGAVFWTFGFPIALTVVLGIAFRDRPPEPVSVAVEAGPGADALYGRLAASREVRASLRPAAEAREALR